MSSQTDRLTAALAGRYRIDRELGAGGMATVYLADDLKHDRKVALKVLKPELAAMLGAERFVAEIRTTAGLQHPHILPLFDSGSADEFLFYVMPFIEGESLRRRLDRERMLPIEDAVSITTGVASALAYAHRQGVIHRDIKPENILLHDGHTLVADFGIALAISNAGGSRVTQTGLSIGTPQYMSPEQASAERHVDGRSDIFSLGSVCYEMLAGESPFHAPTVQGVVSRVLAETPRPLSSLRRSVPAHVADAVHRALEKLPADRWNTASDFAEALQTPATTRPRSWQPGSRRQIMALSAVAAAAMITGVALDRTVFNRDTSPRAAPASARRWMLALPDSAPFSPTSDEFAAPRQALAISADGERVAYVGRRGDASVLQIVRMGDGAVSAVEGTNGARLPAFSPDGNWIAFVAGGELRKVSVAGGAVVRLAPVEAPTGVFWLSDERLLISRSAVGPVVVPAAGGRAEPLGSHFRALSFVHTQSLPGGKYLLGTTAYGDLGAISFETGALQFITVSEPGAPSRAEFGRALRGSNPRYLGSGHLVYASGSTLMAVAFDPRTLVVTGRPTPVLSGVRNEGSAGEAHFAVSDEGTLVFAPGLDGSTGRLVWADRHGNIADTLPVHPVNVLTFRLSRDGRKLAVVERLPNSQAETFIADLSRGVVERARLQGEFAVMNWTADDRRLIGYHLPDSSLARGCCFTASELDATALSLHQVEAPAGLRLMSDFDESNDRSLRCSDAFPGERRTTEVGILRQVARNAQAVRITSTMFQGDCAFSPDSKWLAFTSADGLHLTRATLDSSERIHKLVPDATSQLRWNGNGREIVYRAGRSLFAIEVRFNGDRPESSPPRRLFQRDGFFRTWDSWGTGWDLAPDGRFVIWQGPTQPPVSQLHAVTNVGALIARTLGAPAPAP